MIIENDCEAWEQSGTQRLVGPHCPVLVGLMLRRGESAEVHLNVRAPQGVQWYQSLSQQNQVFVLSDYV